jgi:hypothetical protein
MTEALLHLFSYIGMPASVFGVEIGISMLIGDLTSKNETFAQPANEILTWITAIASPILAIVYCYLLRQRVLEAREAFASIQGGPLNEALIDPTAASDAPDNNSHVRFEASAAALTIAGFTAKPAEKTTAPDIEAGDNLTASIEISKA